MGGSSSLAGASRTIRPSATRESRQRASWTGVGPHGVDRHGRDRADRLAQQRHHPAADLAVGADEPLGPAPVGVLVGGATGGVPGAEVDHRARVAPRGAGGADECAELHRRGRPPSGRRVVGGRVRLGEPHLGRRLGRSRGAPEPRRSGPGRAARSCPARPSAGRTRTRAPRPRCSSRRRAVPGARVPTRARPRRAARRPPARTPAAAARGAGSPAGPTRAARRRSRRRRGRRAPASAPSTRARRARPARPASAAA